MYRPQAVLAGHVTSRCNQVDVTVECLVGWNVVWQSGYGQKGVTPVTDGTRDGWKASCRGDVFVLDELVPFDLQQLPLTLHMKGLEGSRISGEKRSASDSSNLAHRVLT